MLKFIYILLSSLFLIISLFLSVSSLINKKYNFRDIRVYLFFILIFTVNVICWYFISKPFKIIILTLSFSIFIFCIFKENFIKSIFTSIFYQFVIIISELIFAIITIPFFNIDMSKNFFIFLSNLVISIFAIILCRIKLLKQFYNYLIKITKRIKQQQLLIIYLLIILIADIFGMLVYYKVTYIYLLIFNTLFTLFCFYIVIISFKVKDNYIKVYDKYNTTLNSLKEYEDILDKYRVSNHENKNHLLTIRNMISDKNKEVVKYIDELVKNKLKDDEKIMKEALIIPSGGLRGLIYSKILYMKEIGIKYDLNISKSIRTVELINKIDDADMLDICQIVGVYVDNAIEAVEKIKDKYINIEMYLEDNNLVFGISNYYIGRIELEKLDQEGYTTKGLGHGYGLTLTREIINKNQKLNNEKRLSKDTFTQILKIRMY